MKYLQLARSEARFGKQPASERVISGWYTWPMTLLIVSGAVLFAWSAPAVADGQTSHPRMNTFMKREWGIEILFVRQTAAGYMLEFRYKVLDAEKAKSLFERQNKPLLTHAETGAQLIVPTPAKTGALRNSNPPKDDHIYWMFFANPGKLVKPGERVNIQIGDFLAENLVVQ
jgi:hypothetical protein